MRMRALLKRLFPTISHAMSFRRGFWAAFWLTGEWELRVLSRYVPREKLAIDVGGNIGEYTYHLHRLASRVVTFEPNAHYARELRQLRLPNVEVHEVALSKAPGSAELCIPIRSGGGEAAGMGTLESSAVSQDMVARRTTVETRTLDSYTFQKVGFVKIDVEGHEESVLAGAMQTILRSRPVLLIEIEDRHNPGGIARISAILGACGYAGYFFHNRVCKPIGEFDASVHQVVSPALYASPLNRRAIAYVNNFLFVHGTECVVTVSI